MKKKIHAQLLLISAFVLVLALSLTYIAYHAAFHRQAQRDVETLASVVAASYEEDGSQTFLRSITQEGLRITVIDPTGTVLFESDSDRPMENHLDRPEISAALFLIPRTFRIPESHQTDHRAADCHCRRSSSILPTSRHRSCRWPEQPSGILLLPFPHPARR